MNQIKLKRIASQIIKEVSDILSKIDNDFIVISESCKRVIEDNIIEESFRNDVVFVNEPASPEEFAYSIMKFNICFIHAPCCNNC